ncbi:MAG: acetyl-CoA C-acetyltransferase [FCB group bacterium]|nr:acetyl-CoA C-acetyltransferase [FCB group bacterium]
MQNVYIVSGCRTAVGDFGGAFKTQSAIDLGAAVIKEAVKRAGDFPLDMIDDVVLGCCIQKQNELTVGRLAALKAGLPFSVPGTTIQRNCVSAMQAIVYGVHTIMVGDADVIVAGGTEAMSDAPYFIDGARWGLRLQSTELQDGVFKALTDAYSGLIMGMTAENVAAKWNISREMQDEIALRSHNNAEAAIKAGKFKDEIVPYDVPQRKGDPKVIDTDEHPRMGLIMDDLAKLKPAFSKDGTVTAGNASGINDGAAAVVLMSETKVKELGVKPIARMVSQAVAGVEPELMGYGPVPATQKALERAGMALSDIQLIECNEAFAAQYCACEKLLGWERDIVNVNGSGIGLGHPVGCTGARIVITLLHEMARRDLTVGLATACVGGGMGQTTIWERV